MKPCRKVGCRKSGAALAAPRCPLRPNRTRIRDAAASATRDGILSSEQGRGSSPKTWNKRTCSSSRDLEAAVRLGRPGRPGIAWIAMGPSIGSRLSACWGAGALSDAPGIGRAGGSARDGGVADGDAAAAEGEAPVGRVHLQPLGPVPGHGHAQLQLPPLLAERDAQAALGRSLSAVLVLQMPGSRVGEIASAAAELASADPVPSSPEEASARLCLPYDLQLVPAMLTAGWESPGARAYSGKVRPARAARGPMPGGQYYCSRVVVG
jgi:hypothetical protein